MIVQSKMNEILHGITLNWMLLDFSVSPKKKKKRKNIQDELMISPHICYMCIKTN